MKIERIIKILWIAFAAIVALAILIFALSKDLNSAGQIVNTLGNIIAPFINVSAIFVVVLTYLYQKKSDRRRDEKELINSIYQDLKGSLTSMNYKTNVTSNGEQNEKVFNGTDAIHETIRNLNHDKISIDKTQQLLHYGPMLNIYKYLNSFLDTLYENESLSQNEKKLVLQQISFFYLNNMLIGKEQRGDEECKFHKKKHVIPLELYKQIIQIESKLI